MNTPRHTLNWIEHLPEVGNPILRQRDKLIDRAKQQLQHPDRGCDRQPDHQSH